MRSIKLLCLPALLATTIANAGASLDQWDYSSHGERYWRSHFPACQGMQQSPINISTKRALKHPKAFPSLKPGPVLDFSPPAAPVHIENNGHSIQFEYRGNYSLLHRGESYQLKQFHFHHASETTIDGKHSPLEVHFVHKSQQGHTLVIAVLLDSGRAENILISSFKAADSSPQNGVNKSSFNPKKLLPKEKDFYYFEGSLTTPPCTEGVHWAVMKHKGLVSEQDVRYFAKFDYPANFRHTQPINGRSTYYFSDIDRSEDDIKNSSGR